MAFGGLKPISQASARAIQKLTLLNKEQAEQLYETLHAK
jgi:hypothetical protein